jgi:pimeloyl-ACP methyl ester carboxylesterase
MNSLKRIPACACPVLLIHSEQDEYIPIEHARRLFARAPGRKKFIALNGSHFSTDWQRLQTVRMAWTQLVTGQTQVWD